MRQLRGFPVSDDLRSRSCFEEMRTQLEACYGDAALQLGRLLESFEQDEALTLLDQLLEGRNRDE